MLDVLDLLSLPNAEDGFRWLKDHTVPDAVKPLVAYFNSMYMVGVFRQAQVIPERLLYE